MLLVNNFNPIARANNSNNKGVITNNLRQSIFQSKPDMVSFGTNISEVTKAADEQVSKLTQDFLAKNPDVFGDGFKENFTLPVNSFLEKHGVSFLFQPLRFKVNTSEMVLRPGHIDGEEATLINEECKGIIFNTHDDEPQISKWMAGRTANDAMVNLIDGISKGKVKMNEDTIFFPNPLHGIEFPEEIKENVAKISDKLYEFAMRWVHTTTDSGDLKAQRLQKALKELMPEEEI